MCWAPFYTFALGMVFTKPVFFFQHTWTVASEAAAIIKGTCTVTTFDDTCLCRSTNIHVRYVSLNISVI